ncbi:MAG: DsbA family oxidoreductase [Burkholderiaceae bacterium]|nr:DsbA family oxidoreductase [Burkholderiaceae bacterium]
MIGSPVGVRTLRIDFVSDLTCPWCAIGLRGLEQAIARLAAELTVELHLQAFELNPGIAAAGEPIADYAARKYGVGAAELAQRQALIRQRGAEAGLALAPRTIVCNTFDGHRLLHWAASSGRALALKKALLAAYHERGENIARPEVLLAAVAEAGLAADTARELLASGRYADEVRASVRHWQLLGIASVPAVIIDKRHLITGGQPAEVYELALQQAAEA